MKCPTPRTDALRESFGGDCCGEANKALLLAAEFETALVALKKDRDEWKAEAERLLPIVLAAPNLSKEPEEWER